MDLSNDDLCEATVEPVNVLAININKGSICDLLNKYGSHPDNG
jgi:hypothetical protein